MSKRPGLKIEDTILINEFSDAITKAFDRPVVQLGITTPPPKADVKFLNEAGRSDDRVVIECGVELYGNHSCALVRILQPEGYWDVFLVTMPHGFQVAPPNQGDAYNIPDTPTISEDCRDLLTKVAMRVPSEEKYRVWLKKCCEVIGVQEAPND